MKPFQLGPIRYRTKRSDVLGIAWIMNHSVSYAIVTVGGLDLFLAFGRHQPYGPALNLWIAVFWFIRAGSQLYMGKRAGDWMILSGFGLLGFINLASAFL